jgi:hypothetical protein
MDNFDDAARDIRFALRTFTRAPLVAFTIVSTVALGLGLVAVAFTMLNTLVFRVDEVPDVHEMFAVERMRTTDGEPPRFTRAQFDALRRGTNVFTDAFAQRGDVDSRLNGQLMFGTFVKLGNRPAPRRRASFTLRTTVPPWTPSRRSRRATASAWAMMASRTVASSRTSCPKVFSSP